MNLKEKFKKEILPELKQDLSIKNSLAVPAPKKVVVNVGVGKYKDDKAALETIGKDLASLCGQQPLKTIARKAIAGFKIREKSHIGFKVTLRGQKMYDFISRLVNLSLPRTRDFRGISLSAVDQAGNLTVGIKEHIVFPEISHENVRFIFSLQATVVSSAKNKKEAIALFRKLGFPLKKK